ncbi:MAG: aldo/keto reductase [Luminiphilus sp.]|nr:aldo/keto reductase [Luminiphilus sp.]
MSLTDINGHAVSRICLGTMTWGEQNTEQEAHAQIDYALEHGINFMDAAEMYPVPPRAETQGRTEQYIGSWFANSGRREDWILATKATGPREEFDFLRGGPRFIREHLVEAVDKSLQRLKTDYIDLYQLHWPERTTNCFGVRGYTHRPDADSNWTAIEDVIRTLKVLIQQGKIRGYGLSNETPWGAMTFLQTADREGLPPPQSIQNPYSLLNRTYEIGLAEISHRENIGLLAYSPLAMGLLTGKYRNGALPEGSRLALFKRFARYASEPTWEAAERYVALAEEHGLNPTQMALAFVNNRPFLLSNIIGATSVAQLEQNIRSLDVVLSKEVRAGIKAIHQATPDPAP